MRHDALRAEDSDSSAAPSAAGSFGRLPAAPHDHRALDTLLPVVFDELRQLARRQLARESDRFTLQTTELVHEAYLRLAGADAVTGRGHAYFYAAAARAMREVLIDAARRRNAGKRGAGERALSLDDQAGTVDAYADELLDLDVAMRELERRNPRSARVVECRFFAGMTVEDTALALGVSERTVKSDWALARAWLHETLAEPDA